MSPVRFQHTDGWNETALLALAKVEVEAFWDTRFMLLSQLMMPVAYFLFIALPLSPVIPIISFMDRQVPYMDYVLVGLISMNMMSQMTRVIYRIAMDRQYGLFAQKRQCGVSSICYIMIMCISSLMAYTLQGGVFYGIVLLFSLHIDVISFLLIWVLGGLSFFFWGSIAAMIAVQISSYQTRDAVVSFVVVPLSFSAPAFYDLENAPVFVQWLAQINPLTYQLQALREAAFGGLTAEAVLGVLGISVAFLGAAAWVVSCSPLISAGRGE